jgi:hypothetical protein
MKAFVRQSLLGIIVSDNVGGLRKTHVEDIIAQEQLVSGVSQNLGNFFSVFDSSHIKISWISIKLHGLFCAA